MCIMEDYVSGRVCVFVRVRVCFCICACVCGSHNLPRKKVGALKFGSSLKTTSLYTVPNIIIIGPREPAEPRRLYHTESCGILKLRKGDKDVRNLRGLALANTIERTKTG